MFKKSPNKLICKLQDILSLSIDCAKIREQFNNVSYMEDFNGCLDINNFSMKYTFQDVIYQAYVDNKKLRIVYYQNSFTIRDYENHKNGSMNITYNNNKVFIEPMLNQEFNSDNVKILINTLEFVLRTTLLELTKKDVIHKSEMRKLEEWK